MAKLRSKLRQLDSVKKDELIRKLEAKEQECLEYRARLDPMKQVITEERPTPQALEAEVERQMSESRSHMAASRMRIETLIQEMSLLKTTLVPRMPRGRSQDIHEVLSKAPQAPSEGGPE